MDLARNPSVMQEMIPPQYRSLFETSVRVHGYLGGSELTVLAVEMINARKDNDNLVWWHYHCVAPRKM